MDQAIKEPRLVECWSAHGFRGWATQCLEDFAPPDLIHIVIDHIDDSMRGCTKLEDLRQDKQIGDVGTLEGLGEWNAPQARVTWNDFEANVATAEALPPRTRLQLLGSEILPGQVTQVATHPEIFMHLGQAGSARASLCVKGLHTMLDGLLFEVHQNSWCKFAGGISLEGLFDELVELLGREGFADLVQATQGSGGGALEPTSTSCWVWLGVVGDSTMVGDIVLVEGLEEVFDGIGGR
eukprot:1009683-Amphidinium_carterae.3